ncbi:acyltransferase [Proteus mirabilis]|uniref:acyltransferase n=1 Tax=Proteus mirabilis TaxID=584 RepID=UPI003D027D03
MSNNRIVWLDYIRALACVMVILLHSSSIYLNKLSEVSKVDWTFSNLVDSATRVCVPLFFMLSGFIFFNEKKPKAKNFIKLISALAFYTLLVFLVKKISHLIMPNLVDDTEFYFITEPAFYHLWFFYPLLVVYFASYLIDASKFSFKKTIVAIFFLCVIFNPNFSYVMHAVFGISIKNYFMVDGDYFYYIIYSVIGAMFKQIEIKKTKITFIASLCIYAVLTMVIFLLTQMATIEKGEFVGIYYSYTSPQVILSAIAIFWLFLSIKNRLPISLIVMTISKYSLGIYGIHAIILYGIQKVFKYYEYPSLIMIPIIFIIVLIFSILFAIVIRKFDRYGYVS